MIPTLPRHPPWELQPTPPSHDDEDRARDDPDQTDEKSGQDSGVPAHLARPPHQRAATSAGQQPGATGGVELRVLADFAPARPGVADLGHRHDDEGEDDLDADLRVVGGGRPPPASPRPSRR